MSPRYQTVAGALIGSLLLSPFLKWWTVVFFVVCCVLGDLSVEKAKKPPRKDVRRIVLPHKTTSTGHYVVYLFVACKDYKLPTGRTILKGDPVYAGQTKQRPSTARTMASDHSVHNGVLREIVGGKPPAYLWRYDTEEEMDRAEVDLIVGLDAQGFPLGNDQHCSEDGQIRKMVA